MRVKDGEAVAKRAREDPEFALKRQRNGEI